jgi:uncharacterized protein (DUF608 family)
MKKYTHPLFLGFLVLMLSCTAEQGPDSNKDRHAFNDTYRGSCLNRVAFPIGGMGAGMICLEGTGAISHVSVRNEPAMFNEPAAFAASSLPGVENGAKVLEGPVPDWKVFGQPGAANGAAGSTYGLPRFDRAEFDARFPFGTVRLSDEDLPLEVRITGWSPFIPLDRDNSSLPCGALEYSFTNTGNRELEALFSYNSVNFMGLPGCQQSIRPISNGFILSNEGTEEAPHQEGHFAVFTADHATQVDHCWFRGGWWDPLSMTWKQIGEGVAREREPVEGDAPGASLYLPFQLKPGEEKTIRLMFAWYVPQSRLRTGEPLAAGEASGDEAGSPDAACDPATGCCSSSPYYRPWYGSRFKNIGELASYWISNYEQLKERTEAFTEAFYASTLPPEVTEAVAANLTILKSPTVLRQHDGRLWCWEGCTDNTGCCSGSCTHVWNYAQAIPHLFPSLERTLRETEFFYSQNEEGHQTFRSALPIRQLGHGFHAAADGQLGGIMKLYREWRISGDDRWMEELYPLARRSLDYCIGQWDPRGTGTLEEPHHNTYDIEFWGPDGMCTSFYLGALKAFILMGKYQGDDVSRYETLLEKGTRAMEEELFDGEYFIQDIRVEGLDATSPSDMAVDVWNISYSEEALELLKKEGPKYQYGKGCLSDGVLGLWIAKVCGIDESIVDGDKVMSHLLAVHSYNFRDDLSDHANPQRPTFAMRDDGGLLLCSWPKGGRLSLPFVYSNEVWTGIEYQVASHLMFLGRTSEALEIVRACRLRYDGSVRNPFDEYECGHWYARAMASYGLIQGLTGIRYDAVNKTLYIDSQVGEDFNSFFSCQTGFGNIGLEKGVPFVRLAGGSLDVKHCYVSGEPYAFTDANMQ